MKIIKGAVRIVKFGTLLIALLLFSNCNKTDPGMPLAEYVGGLREVANENGLKLWMENYGHWGFLSEFLMYGGQSDLISGEYWNEGTWVILSAKQLLLQPTYMVNQ